MKKCLHILSIITIFALVSSVSSCKAGYGCPAEEAYLNKDKKELSNKRGKSQLFSKKKTKKMKKRGQN